MIRLFQNPDKNFPPRFTREFGKGTLCSSIRHTLLVTISISGRVSNTLRNLSTFVGAQTSSSSQRNRMLPVADRSASSNVSTTPKFLACLNRRIRGSLNFVIRSSVSSQEQSSTINTSSSSPSCDKIDLNWASINLPPL